MKNSKRKGFTLVELLIVIVVIGILSAMMMLSSTEAVTSAKASNIVSNLRNLKTAATAFFVDHVDSYDVNGTYTDINTHKDTILTYMNSSGNVDGSYSFTGTKTGNWYVKCNVSDDRVITKLQGRASSVGLVSVDKSQKYVAMWIR